MDFHGLQLIRRVFAVISCR